MGANLVILDPTLCLTTPAYHWLSTGVRALDHCVEALCSLQGSGESDARAEKALRMLAPGLLACKRGEADVQARMRCQMAVRYAMENVRAGTPMGGSHAIGHQLGELMSCRVKRTIYSVLTHPRQVRWESRTASPAASCVLQS